MYNSIGLKCKCTNQKIQTHTQKKLQTWPICISYLRAISRSTTQGVRYTHHINGYGYIIWAAFKTTVTFHRHPPVTHDLRNADHVRLWHSIIYRWSKTNWFLMRQRKHHDCTINDSCNLLRIHPPCNHSNFRSTTISSSTSRAHINLFLYHIWIFVQLCGLYPTRDSC